MSFITHYSSNNAVRPDDANLRITAVLALGNVVANHDVFVLVQCHGFTQ